MPPTDIRSLVTDLAHVNARWEARRSELSALTKQEKMSLPGVIVDKVALATAMAPSAMSPVAPLYDRVVDWRQRDGNHVTPPGNQLNCGSCVSFSACGVVESIASIEIGAALDLSEADLHFGSSHGPSCSGWWPDKAYDEIKSRGIVAEASFTYMDAFDQPPEFDPDTHLWIPHSRKIRNRKSSAVKITTSGTLSNPVARKNYLTAVGPCTAVFRLFDDFYSYGRGVYHHVSGADLGLHCVEVIGYSELEQCWICKNSWGHEWGDAGFFKIAYGEGGIDTEFPFWIARGIVLPPSRSTSKPKKRGRDRRSAMSNSSSTSSVDVDGKKIATSVCDPVTVLR